MLDQKRIYDTSSNETSSTEPFRRKGFLSKCHFVECPLRRNRISSNTFDEIFNAHLAAILYLLILSLYHVIVRLRTRAKMTDLNLTAIFIRVLVNETRG